MKRIVILGGGCGGLSVARGLRFVHAHVTVVDRNQAHVFQSRLYRAAVSGPRRLQAPLAELLHGQKNVVLVQSEALFLDTRQRRLILADRALPYDTLVVAAGSRPRFERDAWEGTAPALKTAADALRIHETLRNRDSAAVIVGGGPAGVELAAAVVRADRVRRVVLLESGPRILSGFPERLAEEAARILQRMGVETLCNRHLIGLDTESVRVSGEQGRERIPSRAVVWTGGVRGARFAEALRTEAGAVLDEQARVVVQPDLTVPGHPEIFVIGDLARVLYHGAPLDGLATVAAQQGSYVASAIRERLTGYDARPFEYVDQGRFVLLARNGIGVLGDAHLRGASGWLAARLAQTWSAPEGLLPQLRAYSAATGSST